MKLSKLRLSSRAISTVVGLVVVLVGAFIGVDKVSGSASPSNTATDSSNSSVSTGSTSGGSTSTGGWIDASKLPAEAQTVLKEIDRGGPYEYPGKDGSVFGNYEGFLPHESSGYYHEYTVDTPGASTRGTRRIITGRGGEFYWTADHYESFQRIRLMSAESTLAALLTEELPRGVYRLASRYDGEQIERIALDAGWLFAPVWGTGTKAETLEAIGEALGFGDHYGRNLDALNDCLRDLVGRTLLLWVDWAGLAEKDPAAMRAILRVLGDSELLAVVLAGPGPELDVPVLEG